MRLPSVVPILAIAIAVLSGCGSVRPSGPPEAIACDLQEYVVADVFSDWGLYRKRLITTQALDDAMPSFNVLALSAGGQYGAYGAGFLNGWASAGAAAVPGRRSDIQVVTGVSTGAILATHAFLGMDAEIEAHYLSLSGNAIYRQRQPWELITANSLMDASGKDRMIESALTSTLIDRVAATPPGRFLYLGVVDLDDGRFLRIDMVKLARELKPASRRDACYRAVVGASSAIPIAFPPTFVDKMMLTDGGARRHLFLTAVPDEAKAANVRRRLYTFVHGDLDVGCGTTKNGVLQIAGRAAELFSDQSFKDSIRLTDALAKAPVAQGSSAPLFQTYYASGAGAARACEPKLSDCKTAVGVLGEDMFCKPYIECLAARGREDGRAQAQGQKAWLQLPDLNLSSTPACASGGARATLLP